MGKKTRGFQAIANPIIPTAPGEHKKKPKEPKPVKVEETIKPWKNDPKDVDLEEVCVEKTFRISKSLSPKIREYYKDMGIPDFSQNWLELFTPIIIQDLFAIMNYNSDNQEKSDRVTELLEPMGFRDLGLGTNITVMTHVMYPGVVFKIALDTYGLADNFNDVILSKSVPRYAKVYARDPSSMVSVQQRFYVMNRNLRDEYYYDIISTVKELSKQYLVADMSPDKFLNYGIGRDGKLVIIDGSDLYPLSQLKKRPGCRNPVDYNKKSGKVIRCGGELKYTDDFYEMRCVKCGTPHDPLELRPRKEERAKDMAFIMRDGFTQAERDEIDRQTIILHEKIHGKNVNARQDATMLNNPTVVSMSDMDEDDEETVMESESDKSIGSVIFVTPDSKKVDCNGTPKEYDVEIEDCDDDDLDDDEITTATYAETMRRNINDWTAPSRKPMDDDFDDDEDFDDDDEETVMESYGAAPIEYSIENKDGIQSIMIDINGEVTSENFAELYEKYGLPIRISDGRDTVLAVPSSALKAMIVEAIEDLL